MFYFEQPTSREDTVQSDVPVHFTKEYATLPKRPDADELDTIHNYIANKMGMAGYVVHSESDFDYLYENVPNHIRKTLRGWVVEVNYNGKFGFSRKTFIIRVLPSPLYEIEMQKAYDEMRMRRASEMRVAKVEDESNKKPVEEPPPKEIDEDRIVKMYNMARAESEQHADIPATIDAGFTPATIPVFEDDRVGDNMKRKMEIDDRRKEEEIRSVNSFIRNKKKLQSLSMRNG